MNKRALTHGAWTRSRNGLVAGVCEGLGEQFGISAGLLRLIWLASILFFGAGLFVYLGLAIALPREDDYESQNEEKILGVCLRMAERMNMSVGLVRFLALVVFFSSMGLTFVGYVILHFVLEEKSELNSSNQY